MAEPKRTRTLAPRVDHQGIYPSSVQRAAVALLRAIHREYAGGRYDARYLAGDPLRTANQVLVHVAHALYDGYPEPLGGRSQRPRVRRDMSKVVARKVWDRDDWTCRHCGDHRDLTVDHIVPLSKGGADEMDNYQTLCAPCNSRKGNR